MSVNDVYLVATIIALVALPLSLFVRSKGVKPNVSASVGKTEVAEA